MGIQDIVFGVGKLILGNAKVNRIAINRLVKAGPIRPHAWSTRNDDYISWSGLTDKTWFARLLPPAPVPPSEGIGTSRPPLDQVAKVFLAAEGEQIVCPKSTCLFPAFAQYLTDGFLRTRLFNEQPGPGTRVGHEDRKRTTSNHEIDLSALYGRTDEQTDVLREKKGGRLKSQRIGGEEYPPFLYGGDGKPKDEFCGSDGLLILDEPLGIDSPTAVRATLFAVGGDRVNASVQVAMINTLFLRDHNRIASALAKDNPEWSDERLFQVARNIVIVKFIKVVVEDYINHISSAPFRFMADPAAAWGENWNRPNWMTIEFTLLYRWHSLVPEKMQWNGKEVRGWEMLLNNTLLVQGGLSNALVQISDNSAARMGLGNVASFLGKAEEKGILQGRINNLRSYNEYRKTMGLPIRNNFSDVVGKLSGVEDAARRDNLAAELENLYGHIDNLEFYVGLFAEPCLENSPLPELIQAMVAMDAFSQALPNPLLCQRIWENPENLRSTFTDRGVAEIAATSSLRDIITMNCPDLGERFVGMTRSDWRRQ